MDKIIKGESPNAKYKVGDKIPFIGNGRGANGTAHVVQTWHYEDYDGKVRDMALCFVPFVETLPFCSPAVGDIPGFVDSDLYIYLNDYWQFTIPRSLQDRLVPFDGDEGRHWVRIPQAYEVTDELDGFYFNPFKAQFGNVVDYHGGDLLPVGPGEVLDRTYLLKDLLEYNSHVFWVQYNESGGGEFATQNTAWYMISPGQVISRNLDDYGIYASAMFQIINDSDFNEGYHGFAYTSPEYGEFSEARLGHLYNYTAITSGSMQFPFECKIWEVHPWPISRFIYENRKREANSPEKLKWVQQMRPNYEDWKRGQRRANEDYKHFLELWDKSHPEGRKETKAMSAF